MSILPDEMPTGNTIHNVDSRVREILGQSPIQNLYINLGTTAAMGDGASVGTMTVGGATGRPDEGTSADATKPEFKDVYDVEDWFFGRDGEQALDEQMHLIAVAVFSRNSIRFIEAVRYQLKQDILGAYREPTKEEREQDNRPIKPVGTPLRGGQRRLYRNTATHTETVHYFDSGISQQVETIVFDDEGYRETVMAFLRSSPDLAELRKNLDLILLGLCIQQDDNKLTKELGIAQPALTRNQAALAVGELAKGDYGYYRRTYINPLIAYAEQQKKEGNRDGESMIYIAMGWILYGIAKDSAYRQMVLDQLNAWLGEAKLSSLLAATYACIPLSFLPDGGLELALKMVEKALVLEQSFIDLTLSEKEFDLLVKTINLKELLMKERSSIIQDDIEKVLKQIKVADFLQNEELTQSFSQLLGDKNIKQVFEKKIIERIKEYSRYRLHMELNVVMRTLFFTSASSATQVLYLLAKWQRMPANTPQKKLRQQWAKAFFLTHINGDAKFINDYQKPQLTNKNDAPKNGEENNNKPNPDEPPNQQLSENQMETIVTLTQPAEQETPKAEAPATNFVHTPAPSNEKKPEPSRIGITLWQVVIEAIKTKDSTVEHDMFDLVQACLLDPKAPFRDAAYRVMEGWLEEGDKDRSVRAYIQRQLYAIYNSPRGYLYVNRLVNSRKYATSPLARQLRENAPQKPI